jgi:hypothetical protein
LRVPKCAEVKILSWADFSVISRADGDRELRFLVPDRGGAPATNQIGRPYVMACRPPTFTSFKSFIAGS